MVSKFGYGIHLKFGPKDLSCQYIFDELGIGVENGRCLVSVLLHKCSALRLWVLNEAQFYPVNIPAKYFLNHQSVDICRW